MAGIQQDVRGLALWGPDRYEEARAAFDRALALDPKFATAWNNKINLLDRLGRKTEAEEARRRRGMALREG